MFIRKSAVIFAAIMVLALCSCHTSDSVKNNIPAVTGEFAFSVLKVGQADAIILKTQNHSVIIDCGETDDGDEVVKYLRDNDIDAVDYLFITHFDKDHVGGVPEVLDHVNVERIVTPDYEGANEEYVNYLAAVNKHGYNPLSITEDMSFTLDDTLFEVYAPKKTQYAEEDNDFSLAIGITHGENKFLFTGDAENERMTEILTQVSGGYDFLKVPHHGKYHKKTKEFFQKINPDYAVITCSDKNPAEEKTVAALESVNSKIYYTSGGDISVTSDGQKISVTQ